MAEIYGDTFIETARDQIVAYFNALKTTMATGYDPTFSFVYDYHGVAKLELNAVTVALEQLESDFVTAVGDTVVLYRLTFSVRIHTAYEGGLEDTRTMERLGNSLINKLKANVGPVDGFYIEDVSGLTPVRVFDESRTIGGEFQIVIVKTVTHTQE